MRPARSLASSRSRRRAPVRATSLPSADLARAAVARVVSGRTIASTLAGLAAEVDRFEELRITDHDLGRALQWARVRDGGCDE